MVAMCSFHETQYGRPDPDCDACQDAPDKPHITDSLQL